MVDEPQMTTQALGVASGGEIGTNGVLDRGVAPYVIALRDGRIETFESCEGGPGHAYTEPTVRFHGEHPEGFRALAVAQYAGLPVLSLRRIWPILEGEPTGPYWEMTFRERAP